MSPRQAPRDLRASDADRDRVLALLADAVSDGRLTIDEHAERVQRACTARTLGELADLTADLVVVPETLTVNALFGEVEVDLTEAILQARHVQLLTTVIGGRLRLVVPDGVTVAVNSHLLLGRRRGATPPPASSDTPVIEVKGVVLGGEIIVRTPPRSRRFRLFGSRRLRGVPGGSSPRG